MLEALKRFFETRLFVPMASGDGGEQALRLATAALLTEMARQDERITPEERQTIEASLVGQFGMTSAEAQELMTLAEGAAAAASGYFQFTSLINDRFSMEQKIQMVELLWRVAYADGRLDLYEEHMVRKVADLLYVPHADFIAAKLRVAGDP